MLEWFKGKLSKSVNTKAESDLGDHLHLGLSGGEIKTTISKTPKCKPIKRNVLDLIALNDLNRQVYADVYKVEPRKKAKGDYGNIPRVWYEVVYLRVENGPVDAIGVYPNAVYGDKRRWFSGELEGDFIHSRSSVAFTPYKFDNPPSREDLFHLAHTIQDKCLFTFESTIQNTMQFNTVHNYHWQDMCTYIRVSDKGYRLPVPGSGIPRDKLEKYFDIYPKIGDIRDTYHYSRAYVVDDLNSPEVGYLKIPYTHWGKEFVLTLQPKKDHNWIIKEVTRDG